MPHVVQASNILLDALPSAIEVDGHEIEIDTDFRTAIRFTQLMQDGSVPDDVKIELALYAFIGDEPIYDVKTAMEELLWFYRCGADDRRTRSADRADGSTAAKVFDYEHDAALIYAAFMQQYGIDLQTVDHMHWWRFKALFSGLSKQTEFSRVVGYRSIRIDSSMSPEQVRHYRRLKEYYALPDMRTEDEKDGDFARALMSL